MSQSDDDSRPDPTLPGWEKCFFGFGMSVYGFGMVGAVVLAVTTLRPVDLTATGVGLIMSCLLGLLVVHVFLAGRDLQRRWIIATSQLQRVMVWQAGIASATMTFLYTTRLLPGKESTAHKDLITSSIIVSAFWLIASSGVLFLEPVRHRYELLEIKQSHETSGRTIMGKQGNNTITAPTRSERAAKFAGRFGVVLYTVVVAISPVWAMVSFRPWHQWLGIIIAGWAVSAVFIGLTWRLMWEISRKEQFEYVRIEQFQRIVLWHAGIAAVAITFAYTGLLGEKKEETQAFLEPAVLIAAFWLVASIGSLLLEPIRYNRKLSLFNLDRKNATVATVTLQELLAAAERVGVTLRRVTSSEANLYVWATPADEVVYIGKQTSAGRLEDEQNWIRGDPGYNVLSGIVTLLRVNRAQLHPLHYATSDYDRERWSTIRNEYDWSGSAFDAVDEWHDSPSVKQVENMLVRIAVRYGAPIGNSQFASQWENPIGTIPDTLAVLALTDAPDFAIPPYEPAVQRVEDGS